MKLTKQEQDIVRRKFCKYCIEVLKGEAQNYLEELDSLWEREINFSDLREDILNPFHFYDEYSEIFCTVAAGDAAGFFKGTVQALNELLERAELFGYFIAVCKANDLGDGDVPIFFNLKLLGSKWIGTVTISDEFQGFAREILKLIKRHAHGNVGIHERPYDDSSGFGIVVDPCM